MGVDLGVLKGAWQRYRRDFWSFAKWLKTEDQESRRRRPFPVVASSYIFPGVNDGAVIYPHLDSLVRDTEICRILPILKSRRLFVSNTLLGLLSHGSFFTDANEGQSYLGGIGCDNEEKAFDLLDRVRLMYSELPEWMRLFNPLVVDNASELRFARGGQLLAFSSSVSAVRGYGFTHLLLDEFAFHPNGREILKAARGAVGAGGCIWLPSTPNGKDNAFYDLCSGRVQQDLYVARPHWSQIPGRGPEFKARMMAELHWSEAEWAQEMDHSFEVIFGPTVFDFDYSRHSAELTGFADNPRTVYIGWDLGFDRPAAVFAQKNAHDQIILVACLLGHRVEWGKFVQEATELFESIFGPNHPFLEVVPHDSLNPDKTGSTWLQVMRRLGRSPRVNRRKKPEDGWTITRRLMELRADGRPGLVVNRGMQANTFVQMPDSQIPEQRNLILEGMMGGFQRKQQKLQDGTVKYSDEPLRDNVFIHVFDAWNQIAQEFFRHMLAVPDGARDSQKNEPTIIMPGVR